MKFRDNLHEGVLHCANFKTQVAAFVGENITRFCTVASAACLATILSVARQVSLKHQASFSTAFLFFLKVASTLRGSQISLRFILLNSDHYKT